MPVVSPLHTAPTIELFSFMGHPSWKVAKKGNDHHCHWRGTGGHWSSSSYIISTG